MVDLSPEEMLASGALGRFNDLDMFSGCHQKQKPTPEEIELSNTCKWVTITSILGIIVIGILYRL
ncbi:hypothetical protein NO1_1277 [Candidatus Termititenax aidoneus]|uniref:Uncharacterized protein n=1 Tax=Termititenax aidoneus TaxID=2218524 RepID=A0A388TB75_TERA1|nr:hypothetical protein NO1_1277 [Candidatus Termititenax aidoneus]